MNVRTFVNQAAQGDLLLMRVKSIPDGYVQITAPLQGHVVAHSETGHHHVVEAQDYQKVRLYRPANDTGEMAGMRAYLEVLEGSADVVHHRPYDTHETIRMDAGIYEIRRQREHSPQGWRRVED